MSSNGSGTAISPTDLVDAMECEHRSALKTALAAGVPGAPTCDSCGYAAPLTGPAPLIIGADGSWMAP
ncbi:MAG: hypothetical protein M0026_09015 [Nocardiopsaceae bacterium]|nr:hypothetical protein [Nocardiopsaceae bacterium]